MSVTTAQVVTLLENVLFESPTVAAANAPNWVAQEATTPSYASLDGLAAGMAASPEAGIVQQVVRYYTGALGRAPGGFEIQYYVDIAEQGLTPAQIAQGNSAVPQSNWNVIASDFANSPEFTFIASGSSVVSLLYFNVLRRIPGTSEVAYYNNQIAQGVPIATLVQEFTNSAEYQTSINGTIQTALANYGLDVVAGNTPNGIPLTTGNQAIVQTLGATDTTITGTAAALSVTVNGTPASAGQSAVTAVTGVIGVSGVTAATGVQGVTAVAAVAPVAGQSAVAAASDGAVTVTDAAFGTGGAGTITTITLNSSGAKSVINDNALLNLTLSGTAGSLTINNNGSNNVLNLTVNGLTNSDNAITDTNQEIQTLDITTTGADSTLAAFLDGKLTTLNLSGTNALTLSAINSSLKTLNVTGSAGFSDGATTHTGGLAALGGALTLSLSSSGTFSAALDDTTQSFTGAAGTDIIMVGASTDATKTLTAGTATNNEILLEGGAFGLTTASTGKFVNFQIVGVAADVTGTVDLSIVDPTATDLHVHGAAVVSFTKVTAGTTTLTLDPSAGATVSVATADMSGAADSLGVAMSSDVNSLSLQDQGGTGIGTVSIANSLNATDTDISAAHMLRALDDKGLSTLNVSGNAGLEISSLTLSGTSFTLANGSTNGRGVTLDTFADDSLVTLNFSGAGASAVTALTSATTMLAIANTGSAIVQIGTLTSALTSLTLSDNVALGQAATPLETNGLQDESAAGVTIDGGTDNAHVTVNLLAGAASGASDSITLGNGNNVVVDASTAGQVAITLGSGANLVRLGDPSLDTTAAYSVTLAARTAAPPNVIVIGTAGTNYATAANLTITGITDGDVIAFANDSTSSNAALTATSLTAATSASSAIATLEAALSTAHAVAYGVYGGNTYLVETISGVVGASDTTVVEIMGTHTLTASSGYVTLGSTAATVPASTLLGGAFTIPAGVATTLSLSAGANILTLTGPSSGVSDSFSGSAGTTALTLNYRATSGTDTLNLSAVSAMTSLTVNDTSTGSAGVTVGAFSDDALTTATYNNSAATGAVMTQQALSSASLNAINFSGGIAGQSTNTYYFTGTLTTTGGVTIDDTNIGSGTTTMGLDLSGGPSALTLDMTGPGTLATGVLTDDSLATLTIGGSGTGTVDIGTLVDATAGDFVVNDTSTSTGGTIIRLSGLSKAKSLTVNDGSAGALTDSTAYSDSALTALTLKNDGAAALTIAGAGITANSLNSITIAGSGTGSISLGAVTDNGSSPLTITDSSASTVPETLDLTHVSATTGLTVVDSAAADLGLGNLADAAMTSLSLSNSGAAALTIGTVPNSLIGLTVAGTGTGSVTMGDLTEPSLTSLSLSDSGAGTVTVGNVTANALTTLSLSDSGSGTVTVGNVTANALTTLTIGGSATGAVAMGSFSDDLAGAITINDSSANPAARTLRIASMANLTGLTVNDSSAGDLSLFESGVIPSVSPTLTLNNTGKGALTVNPIAEGIGAVTIIGSGTGTETVWLNVGPSFSLTDSSSSTGAASVNFLTSAAATIALTDSAAGSLTASVTGGNALNSITLTNTGSATLSATGISNTTASGAAAFGTFTAAGTGTISGDIDLGNDSGTVTFADTDSGSVTLTSCTIGTMATNTTTLQLSNTNSGSGNFTISSGTVYATHLVLGNTGSGANSVTLSDAASANTTVTVTGTGSETLALTDAAAAVQVTQTGNANVTVTLTHDGISGDSITLGNGNNAITLADGTATDSASLSVGTGTNAITLESGHTATDTLTFSSSLSSNANTTPVTADIVTNFQTHSATVQGDIIAAGLGAGNILTTADVNPSNGNFWTSSNGILSKPGASVLNFIAEVQSVTTAGGTAATSGIAGFSDGTNTWIAYNDHAGHVSVIELVGVVAAGLDATGTNAGFVHIG